MYSQNDEEQFILEYFKDQPPAKFLEIGAYDAERFSNTRALVNLGWSGVLIEPSPSVFPGLVEAYKDNDRIQLVNAALALQHGLIEFYDSSGDAVSTTNPAHMEKWSKHAQYKKFWVNTITMEDIISTFGRNYDFISLDVEGTNVEILKTIDLQHTRLLCVEHEDRDNEILEYCEGFKLLYKSGENLVLGR